MRMTVCMIMSMRTQASGRKHGMVSKESYSMHLMANHYLHEPFPMG